MDTDDSIRLNKYLALQLGISRREADDLIADGKVTVDSEVASLGARFHPGASIKVKGKAIASSTVKYQYLLLNKPTGYVCSRRAQGDNPTIYSLLPAEYHGLKPVGRLDKDSSGLILLTNDGDFAFRMTHPSFHKTKVYEVQLDHPLEPLHQQMISDFGVMLPDGASKFLITKLSAEESLAAIKHLQPVIFNDAYSKKIPREAVLEEQETSPAMSNQGLVYEIHMSEGRNRQIRRTFAALGYTVTALHRTNFGNYSLGDIKTGEYKLTGIS